MTTPNLVQRLLELRGDDRAAALILASAVECAVMLHDGTDSTQQSHLGGVAHEPVDGTSMSDSGLSLLAEIFLSEVPHFRGRQALPNDGLLQVWADEKNLRRSRIVYHPGDVALQVVLAAPVFRNVPIRFQTRISIMDHDGLLRLGVDDVSGLTHDDFYDYVKKLHVSGIEMVTGTRIRTYESGYPTSEASAHSTFAVDGAHQLFGHPTTIQEETWPPDQRLLLQIASDLEGPEWMWGDDGILWFHITEEALINRCFNETTCSWSCC